MPFLALPAGGVNGWGAAAVLWAFAVGYWDIRYRRVPNVLTGGAALAALASLAVTGVSPLGVDGLSMLAGAALALVVTVPGFLVRQLGAGDVKLLVAIALLGGAAATVVSFAIGALTSLAALGAWVSLGPRFGLTPASGKWLPFGAALALGFVVAVFGGQVGQLPWLR
ncbi:MAG: Peptidase prepilin type [Rhodocyclaceae bacterium]|nr:Peptidase prepilin type [Rhodocyclaceae bacterium]